MLVPEEATSRILTTPNAVTRETRGGKTSSPPNYTNEQSERANARAVKSFTPRTQKNSLLSLSCSSSSLALSQSGCQRAAAIIMANLEDRKCHQLLLPPLLLPNHIAKSLICQARRLPLKQKVQLYEDWQQIEKTLEARQWSRLLCVLLLSNSTLFYSPENNKDPPPPSPFCQ